LVVEDETTCRCLRGSWLSASTTIEVASSFCPLARGLIDAVYVDLPVESKKSKMNVGEFRSGFAVCFIFDGFSLVLAQTAEPVIFLHCTGNQQSPSTSNSTELYQGKAPYRLIYFGRCLSASGPTRFHAR
jgi:hypothetical protein